MRGTMTKAALRIWRQAIWEAVCTTGDSWWLQCWYGALLDAENSDDAR